MNPPPAATFRAWRHFISVNVKTLFLNPTLLRECGYKGRCCELSRQVNYMTVVVSETRVPEFSSVREKSVVFRETRVFAPGEGALAHVHAQKRVTVRAAFQRNGAGLGVSAYGSPGIPGMRHELGILGFEISVHSQEVRLRAIMMRIEYCVCWKCVCVCVAASSIPASCPHSETVGLEMLNWSNLSKTNVYRLTITR